jgi:Na+-translocating ferredoxin:NAD+ oxidoreductase RnfG subunit
MAFRLGLLLVVLAAGCAAPKPPTTQLTAAKAAIRGAVEAGAKSAPKGALHLKMARDQVGQAEDLIVAEKTSEARHLLIRAEADGNLAVALAKEAAAKRQLADIKDKLRRLQKNQGGS